MSDEKPRKVNRTLHKFDYGDLVSHSLPSEGIGLVTGFHVIGDGQPCYDVTWNNGSSDQHFECELRHAATADTLGVVGDDDEAA